MADTEKTQPDQAEAANGTLPEAAVPEEVKDKTDEIAATYERAKQDLNDAVTKLRTELSELDMEKARQQAQTWVEENPTLAVVLAAGAGILVGRLLAEAFKSDPPPTFSERLRAQGQNAASQARRYAGEVGDVVADRAAEVGDTIVRRARELGEDVSRRARELGEDVTRKAAGVVAEASERTADWGGTLTEQSSDTTQALQAAAEDLAGAIHRKSGQGRDVVDSLLNAAKSVTAALVVKKVTDWLRRAG